MEAGKNEGEVEKELGQPKLDEVTAKRAKKIIKKLNKEVEAAASSWDITSHLVGISLFIFISHICNFKSYSWHLSLPRLSRELKPEMRIICMNELKLRLSESIILQGSANFIFKKQFPRQTS